jgi:hypothetical protein
VAEAVLEASRRSWTRRSTAGPRPDEGPDEPDGGDGETYSVSNDAELASAMDRARPGDVVELAAGDYATTKLKGEA